MSDSCDTMDCSPPGSSVHGISQARILECVAISFSSGSSWPRDWIHISFIAVRFFTAEPPEFPFSSLMLLKKIFIYFLLHWVLLAACGIFRSSSWTSVWLWPAGSRACGFCSWGMWAYLPRGCGILVTWPEIEVVTRDWTYVPCVGRQFLSTGPPGKSKCYCFFN